MNQPQGCTVYPRSHSGSAITVYWQAASRAGAHILYFLLTTELMHFRISFVQFLKIVTNTTPGTKIVLKHFNLHCSKQ
jgi:hypothetical protein